MRTPWSIILALLALLVIAIAGYTAWARFRPPYAVSIGAPIRHDDFLFTVTDVKKLVLPRGAALYRVSVNVTNQAKVVNYQWRDSIAYVRAFDKDGFGHNFFPLSHGSFILPPGKSHIAQIQFQVPAGMSSANLRFWDGVFMGDAFNGAAYVKAIVPLEPYHPPFGT